jgi:hypothetical protein
MTSRSVKSLMPRLSPSALIALVAVLGVSFIVTVLLPGLKISGDLVSGNAALESVGEQERYPTVIRASLDSLHDRLMTRAYIQESLDQLRDTAAKLDSATNSISGKHAAALREAWDHEREALRPLLSYSGLPYDDNESTGTVLNENGKQLERDVTNARLRGPAQEHRLGEDADHRVEVRGSAVGGTHQGESGQIHQSARRGRGQSRRRQGQGRDALPAVRFPPRACGRQDHPRAGIGVRRERARRSGAGAAGIAAARRRPRSIRLLGISARRPGAAGIILERFECRHENDQRGAARAGPRRKRVPQETRHPVPLVHSVKGEAAALGLVVHREPRTFLRGRFEIAARQDGLVRKRLPAAGDQARRFADPPAVGRRPGGAPVALHAAAHTDTAVIEMAPEADVTLAEPSRDEGRDRGTPPSKPDVESADGGSSGCCSSWPRASANDKEAALQCMGFDTVPDEYRRIVKDIAVQAVRNAIVHGIEAPAVREQAAGKRIAGPACV